MALLTTGRRRAGRVVATAILVGVLAVAAPLATAEVPAATEYEVKAAFLYNFARFVEWPAVALPEAASPIVICILGDDPFGEHIELVTRAKRVNGHPLLVKRFPRTNDLTSCHILFICASEEARLAAVLAALDDLTVLTVGEAPSFTQVGGMIRFLLKDNKVRFEINAHAAERVGLHISSKLLKLAQAGETK